MRCTNCGSETTREQGLCTVCQTPIPSPAHSDVATSVLTPTPKRQNSAKAPNQPPEEDQRASIDDVTSRSTGSDNHPHETSEEVTRIGIDGPESDETPTVTPAKTPRPASGASEEHEEASSAEERGPLTPGEAFGPRYHIVSLLGAGGMGAVYQAWDEELGIAVALKVILPEVAEDASAAQELE